MTTSMGPPPQRNANATSTTADSSSSSAAAPSMATHTQTPEESLHSPSLSATENMARSTGPPPPKNPSPPPELDSDSDQFNLNSHNNDEHQPNDALETDNADVDDSKHESTSTEDNGKQQQQRSPNTAVPYTIPPWSEAPSHHYFLEVLKDGSIIDQFDVDKKGAYMFGRVDLCDFVLEHPTISRFHAVLQFKSNGDAYIYDLGSTHGTFVNKNQVKKKVYTDLRVGDIIRFGHSSRLYIFQGPAQLMPTERDLKSIRNAKVRQEMQDMEASLLRAKLEASLADGVSWGMGEDAIEENEDDIDEITWQTYKGLLTEKQEKTREKVIKRLEKIANMKKEIDAIRAKDISQGGLTQGQQTQIARNEQRISQIMEELENLEETLNESIRESIGARVGRMSRGNRKGTTEDDEVEYLSDDDDFYDRTKKKPSKGKVTENQSIETADSLLDKKDVIIKEIEDKRKLLLDEDGKESENEVGAEAGDSLDAYMSGLSSQIVLDRKEQVERELSSLQSELDRVLYLLKIADPTGDAAAKRKSKAQETRPTAAKVPALISVKQPILEKDKGDVAKQTLHGPIEKNVPDDAMVAATKKPYEPKTLAAVTESKTSAYTVVKPQWLGAVEGMEKKDEKEVPLNMQDHDDFVDYKDRNEILGKSNTTETSVQMGDIENAAPGLILRKRKQVEKFEDGKEVKGCEQLMSSEAEVRAEDAVALLLKHTRGYYVSDDEVRHDSVDPSHQNQSQKDKKKPKRVLGPERPSFLEGDSEYESWVPPEGQSGDGRTSLNDRFGY